MQPGESSGTSKKVYGWPKEAAETLPGPCHPTIFLPSKLKDFCKI